MGKIEHSPELFDKIQADLTIAMGQVRELQDKNLFLAQQVAFLNNQVMNQQNIAIIIASALFRQLGYIEDNRIKLAYGTTEPVRVTQPLVYSISQEKINHLEHLFSTGNPVLGFAQQVVDGQPHLVFRLVSESDAQAEDHAAVNQPLN